MTKNAEKLESASKNTCKRIKKRVFAGDISTSVRVQFPSPAPGKLDKHNFLMKSKKEEKG